jgi:hypothetical protein
LDLSLQLLNEEVRVHFARVYKTPAFLFQRSATARTREGRASLPGRWAINFHKR